MERPRSRVPRLALAVAAGAASLLLLPSPGTDSRAAAPGLSLRIEGARLRTPSWAYWTGILRVRGTLAGADGAPPAALGLPARDLLLRVGDVESPTTWAIPALDPGWTVRGSRWTWRTGRGGRDAARLRLDAATGAFEVFVRDSGVNGVGVYPFWQDGPLIRLELSADGLPAATAHAVLVKRGRWLYTRRPADPPVAEVGVGGPPAPGSLGRREGRGGRLVHFTAAVPGRYEVRAPLGTLWYADLRVWTVPGGAQLGRTAGAREGDPSLLLDLLPGEHFAHVDPVGSGTFAVTLSEPADPEALEPGAAPLRGFLWDSEGLQRIFRIDVAEAGYRAVEVHGLPGFWNALLPVKVSLHGPGEGMPLLAEAEGTDIFLARILGPGRHLLVVCPARSFDTGSFTVALWR